MVIGIFSFPYLLVVANGLDVFPLPFFGALGIIFLVFRTPLLASGLINSGIGGTASAVIFTVVFPLTLKLIRGLCLVAHRAGHLGHEKGLVTGVLNGAHLFQIPRNPLCITKVI